MAKRIAIIYLILGYLWITLSDLLVDSAFTNAGFAELKVPLWQTIKGLFFVTTTAWLLYWYSNKSIKKLELAVKENTTLFDSTPYPSWIYEPETLRILKVNNAACVNYGYSREEFERLTLLDLRNEEDQERLLNRIKERLPTLSKGELWKHKRKNGTEFYVNIYSHPIDLNCKPCRLVLAYNADEQVKSQLKIEALNKELIEREAYLSSILQTQSTFLIRTDMEGKYTFANQAFFDWFGFEPHEIISHPFQETVMAYEVQRCNEMAIECIINPGKIVKMGIAKPLKTGRVTKTNWEFVLIQDTEGNPKEIQGVGYDTSEVEKAIEELAHKETQLAQADKKLVNMLESMTDGFFAADVDYNITYVNHVFEQLLQMEREEIIGKKLWDLFPTAVNSFKPQYDQALNEQTTIAFEEYFETLDIWFDVVAYGSHEGLVVFFQDVTERRKLRAELERNRLNIESLINNTHDLLWSLDTDYKLMASNKAHQEIMEGLVGRRVDIGESLIPEIADPEVREYWRKLYERGLNGEEFSVTTEVEMQDGTKRYGEIAFSPIRNDKGVVVGLACAGRDMTMIKNYLNEIENNNARLQEIAWFHSHKVRGPVANIMGLVSLYNRNDHSDPLNQTVIENLDKASYNLDQVIREIVNTSTEVGPSLDKRAAMERVDV